MSVDQQAQESQTAEAPDPAVMAGVDRFMGHMSGYLAFWLLITGHRTGLLQEVLDGGGSAAELAERAGCAERPVREWLSGMTAAGYLRHDAGTFSVAPGQAALFQGGVLPFDPTVFFSFSDVIQRVQPAVEESMRSGGGVPYGAYQPEFSAAQDAINRPLYENFLVQDWVPGVAGLQDVLERGADVADIGCGGGRALCLLAAAFPASRFVGYDIDPAALDLGRARAAEAGLTNVRFEHRDVADLGLDAELDVVLAVDAIHDQADPAGVAAGVRRALRDGGVFVMVEPTASGDLDEDAQSPMALMGYATSLAHCVQVSLAGGGPGLGGMWGRAGALALLTGAGFTQVDEHASPSDNTVYAAKR